VGSGLREASLFHAGVMDIPAYFFVCVGSIWVGRRITLAFSLFFVSLTCGGHHGTHVSYFMFYLGKGCDSVVKGLSTSYCKYEDQFRYMNRAYR
jgi:hypothetical protein